MRCYYCRNIRKNTTPSPFCRDERGNTHDGRVCRRCRPLHDARRRLTAPVVVMHADSYL